ncbi:MAG: MATE family efflux transporter [Paludibacteraceae bacterium]|nr:MATE family efflux transporter [Paludibacteraceae bacterium]
MQLTPLNRDILRLAIPSILANITIPLVGLVDTAIAGHLSDATAIGGIAIGTMLFDLLYWNFGFLRIGTSGLTAQAYGAGNRNECNRMLVRSLTVAASAALAIWAVQWLFVNLVLAVVPCSQEVAAVARGYFYVRIWAAPATLCLMALKGWFIGMQDTRSPMAVDIVVNIVNMAASYLLAVYTPLGIVGVAWGTLIAQYTGLLLAALILFARYSIRSITTADCRDAMQWSGMRRMMLLNGNLFVRSLCFMVVYVGFTALAGSWGDTQLAVSSMLMKLFMFFSYFVDGFAYAGEALVGKAFGERNHDAVPGIVRLLFAWSLAVGLCFTLVYAVCGRECIGVMTDDTNLLAACTPYLGWLVAMPIVSTLAFMWDGIYVGATAGVPIRNSMIAAASAFVLLYAVTFRWAGPQALYIAYFAHLLARVIYLSLGWNKTLNNYKSPITYHQ